MRVVTIDFETYYDKEYSLKKLTTEHYIRSPLFEVIGVSVKIEDGLTIWFSGTHQQISDYLKSVADWPGVACLAHNAAFDGAILSWKFGITPALWLDTLSMARPLHLKTIGVSLDALSQHYNIGAKGREVRDAIGKRRCDFTPVELANYGTYSINDTELTYALYKILRKHTTATEVRAIDTTIRMFTEPVFVLDDNILEEHLRSTLAKKRALLDSVGGEESLALYMSNDKFAEVLSGLGVEPPKKISKRTGKETWAFAKTDQGLKDLLEHPDPAVQSVVACRLGVKSTIEETRAQSLLGVAQRGPLPIMLNYWGAGTGRFSGGDKLNAQNFSRGGKIRDSICVEADSEIVVADLSQIEARLLAYIAGQEDLVEAFRERRDIYSEFASDIYDRTITKADAIERFVGKTCILGLGYGMGASRLIETLRIGQGGLSVKLHPEEAERIVRLYRARNWRIRELWNSCGSAVKNMASGRAGNIPAAVPLSYNYDRVVLPNGAQLMYPGITSLASGFGDQEIVYYFRKRPTKIYGGLLCENIVQAVARGVIVEYMNELSSLYKVALQVHDEIVCVVARDRAAEARGVIQKLMATPPKWLPGLPVACEVGSGASYGKAK